jgi:tetratricopeptide (TPR) repeat protein
MASVFLSYDRDDADRARPLALALEKAGHSVWWDLHVRSGAQFSKVIEEALKAADAVVVLWSVHSVESAWVRDEAAAGRDSGRLVPVSLDDTDPPLGFRQFQTIDLSRWKGRGKPAELRTLFADVEATARSDSAVRPITALPPEPRHVSDHRRSIAAKPLMIASAILFVVIAGVAAWMLLRPSTKVATVAIEASEQTAPSRALARDLLVKLGSLQASNASLLQIVEAGFGAKPDLIFEVAGNADGSPPHAGLVLLSGRDRSLFWSKEFEVPAGRSADLRQQLGFTAARVTGCAVEALNTKGKRLSQGTLKLYLNACAAFAETSGAGSDRVVPMFRQVTREAPAFEGGWTGLLLAEIEVFHGTEDNAQVKEQIKKDVAAARKVHPSLIAINQAEIDLLPSNAFTERMRLADRAVELGPNSPLGHSARSGVLMSIGRMEDSVADAQKAVQFDPLSPPLRDYYIQALLYAGRTDIALQELEKAERLWPGASNLTEARFRINLRYGDAGEALRAVRSDPSRAGWVSVQSYLEARMDPSPPKVEKAIDEALGAYRQYPGVIAHVAQAYGDFGREKELLDILLKAPEADVITATDVIFRSTLVEFWNDPRSLLVAKRAGLLQFWQSSGKWPDFCNARDLPYDCKAEAAKLTS